MIFHFLRLLGQELWVSYQDDLTERKARRIRLLRSLSPQEMELAIRRAADVFKERVLALTDL